MIEIALHAVRPGGRFGFRVVRRKGPLGVGLVRGSAPMSRVVCMIDSGASRTLLSMETAQQLGLERSDLEVSGVEGRDVFGTSFAIWTSRIPIEAQVIADLEGESEAVAWGPPFSLSPTFYESPEVKQQLLGRADFFRAFEVHFHRDNTFTLCYPDAEE